LGNTKVKRYRRNVLMMGAKVYLFTDHFLQEQMLFINTHNLVKGFK
jgi:hypothetical protein